MAYSEPELLDSLIAVLTDATVTYLAAQIEAGAEAVMLFDSWAGVLSPSLFRDLVIAPTAAIVAALRRRYPTVPVIGFPRLAGVMIGSYASVTGIQGVAMDTAADPTIAASLVPPGIAIQGNLDPLAVVAGGEVWPRRRAQSWTRCVAGRLFSTSAMASCRRRRRRMWRL